MKNPIDIRQMYMPIQPTKQLRDNITYSEFLPDLKLKPFILCYWELKSHQPLSKNFCCRIVSDGCIDIYFDVNNSKENYVMGFSDKFTNFLIGNSFHYVGVRFVPAMFPYLFNVNASEFSNRVEDLYSINFQTAQFIAENVLPGHSIGEIKSLFDSYFLRYLSKIDTQLDKRMYEAVLIILKNLGTISIEKDINASIGISARHLRRLFDFYIGDSIKTFSKVVRFQNYLRTQSAANVFRVETLYFDFGYYDQSHFIKEFKIFYGDTPGMAFK